MNMNLSTIEEKVLLNSLLDSSIILDFKIKEYQSRYELSENEYWKIRIEESQEELDILVLLRNKLIYGIKK